MGFGLEILMMTRKVHLFLQPAGFTRCQRITREGRRGERLSATDSMSALVPVVGNSRRVGCFPEINDVPSIFRDSFFLPSFHDSFVVP